VCRHDEKISSHSAMMEVIQMQKQDDSMSIRLFPQRLDYIWRPASSSPTIENTYPQLM